MERTLTNKTLIIISWLSFMACLAMPASIDNKSREIGYTYASFSTKEIPSIIETKAWPTIQLSGISNIFAFLSIFLLLIKSKKALLILGTCALLFFLNNASYLFQGMKEQMVWGYYIWLVSFILICISCLHKVAYKNA